MKKIILALFFLLIAAPLYSQTTSNYGFEDGTYAGWTVSNGSTTLRSSWSSNGAGVQVTTGMQNYCPGGGKCWTITPYGSYMTAIQAGGGSPTFDNALSTLGLSASNITTIKNTVYSNGSMWPTNASSISKTVFLQAGMTYTFAWQYLSTDYVPYNDGSMITLTGGPGTPTINGQTQNYALLGFTNPGTGNYSTNSYGATGWQVAVFTVPADGNYTLGFASFNLGDTALSPILFIDQLQGATLLNGATFTPVQPNAGSTAPPPPSPEPTYPAVTVTALQTAKINQTQPISGNSIYLQVNGNNNAVTIEQFSRNNAIRGPDGAQRALIQGSNNLLTVYQGTASTILGQNLAELSIIGDGNTVSLTQQHNSKYAEIKLNGSSTSITTLQKDAGGKSIFLNVVGSSTINTTQEGSGNHFLDINSQYTGTNVTVNQTGTAQKLFSLTINSPNVGVIVNQTNLNTSDSAAMTITCTTGPCNGYTYTKN